MPADGTWLPIPDNWTAEQYEGALPNLLYRYRQLSPESFDWRLNEILEEVVILAGAGTLNDPDEGRIQWRVDGTREAAMKLATGVLRAQKAYPGNTTDLLAKALEIADNIIASGAKVPAHITDRMHEAVSKLVRVACFTTEPLNQPMWAHYGKYVGPRGEITNGGICIEYEVPESWRNAGLHPVVYGGPRPTINMLARDDLPKALAQAMRVKSEDWSYEKEWRITNFLDATPPWPDNLAANSKLQLSGSVRSVIFGLATPVEVVDRAVGIIRAKNPTLPLKRVHRNPIDESLVVSSL